MVHSFRNITKTAIYEELPGQSDQLYILDINTFIWVRTFNPSDNNPEPSAANELQSNNSINTIMIILIVVAVVLIFIGSTIDIKQHQYIASNLLPSEISSVTNHYARDSKNGDINDTNHYIINNNMTSQYGGNNNMAHQYRSNNNIIHHYGSNNQYATNTNIAPAHETFNVSPDQPFGVVMLNTQSGEMIVLPNVQTTSNYNNYNNYNYRFL
ncbi:hypothetical protein C1645_826386 [Glomus cerebriforme]|uniref:Uncharacterized protein n=1 Tax=Glomus cerebriforme TaxID=658196 RepID=A0A397SZT2_9GLOM|nr:hypothetical protein C1645_826386 [Glomus cerebriforme]